MLVDMNSFFASVEQQANPFFRGKPLGVCASLHETSCLIAASKEAKKLGIKTGTLIYQAKKIYPGIILVESEPEKYRRVNHELIRILSDYSPNIEVYSIDEAFVDLRDMPSNPLKIGAEIKRRIKEEVGEFLTCSVGIGPNKFIAKLAADLKKPDGLSVIWRDQLHAVYETKSLKDLWGVSYGWIRRLEKLGITKPKQLLTYPVQNLISIFGKPGFYLWQRVNGLEEDEIRNNSDPPKSFGHSWVLNFRTTSKDKLKPVILRLAEKAAVRMRKENFHAYGMYLNITLVDRHIYGRSKKLTHPINTGLQLYQESVSLWKDWKFKTEVLHIAVGFSHLKLESSQMVLFGKNNFSLIPALDKINEKYGDFTIRSGLLTLTSDYAPDAIAFGK